MSGQAPNGPEVGSRSDQAAASPVEDGRSPVAGTPRRELTTGTKLGILALVAVLGLGFIWFNALFSHTRADQQKIIPAAYTNGGEIFNGPPVSAMKPAAQNLPAPANTQTGLLDAPAQASPAAAPILAFSGSSVPVPNQPPASSVSQPGATAAAVMPDNSPLAARLKPTVLDGERASVLQNPDMVITEGTMIPCTLQTAIDSQLPGLVTCVVPIDVRGSTGNVVLLDRGTKIVGQMENGLLQGQNRVFVDWTRAETPDHVIVTLDSPGSDELGRAGLPGAVNNHFWDRFGGALMLTLVQGGLQAGTLAAAGNGNGNSTSQQAALGFVYAAQSNGQSVANTALANSINIPPTLTKNQGDTVSLIVAHDLDFSSVYRLRLDDTGAETGNGG
ncbi:type IV secretion system protein VirB10 [Acidocella aminolytica]|uniref:Secretion system type IV protein VirB10 n=1 Tax=Acidocella aminolytica 101 = DSM 11237 TaxID=1120923 RepID=A0A0D6PLQ2_9PROT|nr:type IV secretion system protein VirB10 [Acidocella aminolytica]GAN82296.1 secretion system type IV protein VirB10 [Acidocella aminolytica 101 = DSM 11237]GBQ42465.1 type IV secretion system protein VirB10 [Acidocella aminolytica 101 = DSM 11237]SHF38766.1 type IV secretion system protein VirB10 [Acidocella aminolytica 101 = DSM 11237]